MGFDRSDTFLRLFVYSRKKLNFRPARPAPARPAPLPWPGSLFFGGVAMEGVWVCLKIVFCKMCVTVFGGFVLKWGDVADCGG